MDHNPLKSLFHKRSKSQSFRNDHQNDDSRSAERHPHIRSPPPRTSQQTAGDTLVSHSYLDVPQGAEPEVGTLPYKGNGKSPPPSAVSNGVQRKPSATSDAKTSQRKTSATSGERPAPTPIRVADGRHGFIGGVGRTPSHGAPSTTTRAKTPTRASSNPKPAQTGSPTRSSEEAMSARTVVPAVPQQYADGYSQHVRNTSAVSQASSNLPISDQFSSSSYYAQVESPKKPEWLEQRERMPGEYPETINTTSTVSPSGTVAMRTMATRSDPMEQSDANYYNDADQIRSARTTSPNQHARSRSDNPRNFSRPQPTEIMPPTETEVSSLRSDEGFSPPPSSHGTGYNSVGHHARSSQTSNVLPLRPAEIRQASEQRLSYGKPLLVEGAPQSPTLRGVLNTGRTEDTTVEQITAQPVYHETIKPTVHHITEERIHRDIHYHHIHHRVLPVIDVQVLPTKHYIPGPDGTLIEIPTPPHYREQSSSQQQGTHQPGRNDNFVIAETVSKQRVGVTYADGTAPNSTIRTLYEPRQFTARTFEGTEGETKHYVGEDGIPRSETTWIHPPRLATDLEEQGKTQPVFFGDAEAKDRVAPRYRSGGTSGQGAGQATGGGHPKLDQPLHERLAEEAVMASMERKRAAAASANNTLKSPVRS